MKEKIYYPHYDILRIIAIIGVVCIHASGYLFVESPANTYQWWIANIYMSFGTFSVPVFIMLSGALLLNNDYNSIKVFYLKRVKKIVIPAISWMIIYHFFGLMIHKTPFDISKLLKVILTMKDSKTLSGHLWFIPIIVGLYVATPFLRIFVKNASKRIIFLSLIFWFIFSIVLPFLYQFTGIAIGIEKEVFTPWVGFFILGYFLDKHIHDRNKILFIFLFVFGLIITIFSPLFSSLLSPAQPALHLDQSYSSIPDFFHHYLTPNVLLMASSLFLLIKSVDFSFISPNFLKIMGESIFGIYLIHVILLNPIQFAWGKCLNPVEIFGPFCGILLLVITTFLLSFLSVLLIKKTPVLKNLLI
jgi:surface polysaccharide O-acyltransferase-like enzyme